MSASSSRITTEEMTTARAVERPTPSAPEPVMNPSYEQVIAIAPPNSVALMSAYQTWNVLNVRCSPAV